jgi:hypothetical protein
MGSGNGLAAAAAAAAPTSSRGGRRRRKSLPKRSGSTRQWRTASSQPGSSSRHQSVPNNNSTINNDICLKLLLSDIPKRKRARLLPIRSPGHGDFRRAPISRGVSPAQRGLVHPKSSTTNSLPGQQRQCASECSCDNVFIGGRTYRS